jgi:8-oxo-dGTP diphosphatase
MKTTDVELFFGAGYPPSYLTFDWTVRNGENFNTQRSMSLAWKGVENSLSLPRQRECVLTILNGRSRGVMLLPITDELKLILHHRDDKPGISHPGCWAGFGGSIEVGETAEEALQREVKEETEINLRDPVYLTEEWDHEGDGSLISLYYVVGGIEVADITLHEGDGVGVFEFKDLNSLNLSPFVRRAIVTELLPILRDRTR